MCYLIYELYLMYTFAIMALPDFSRNYLFYLGALILCGRSSIPGDVVWSASTGTLAP